MAKLNNTQHLAQGESRMNLTDLGPDESYMENTVIKNTFNVTVELMLSGVEPGTQPTLDQAEEIIRNALEYVSANGTQIDEVAIDGFSVGSHYLREPLTEEALVELD